MKTEMTPTPIARNPELSPRQHAWLRALAKAQALHTTPRQFGGGHYEVTGSAGAVYHIQREDPDAFRFSCDCPAGRNDRPCYHAAACAALPAEAALRSYARRQRAGEKIPNRTAANRTA